MAAPSPLVAWSARQGRHGSIRHHSATVNTSVVNMIVTDCTTRPEGLTTFVKDNMVYLAIANEGNGNAAATGMSTAMYALAPVPEPETWAMLLSGLGLLGLRARRRKAV